MNAEPEKAPILTYFMALVPKELASYTLEFRHFRQS